MATKESTKKYRVRNFPLHKEMISATGRKSRQTFEPFSQVELTEAQAIRYQQLIETEEQFQSRQPVAAKSKSKTEA